MYDVIAPVVAQRASTKPTIVIVIPVDGRWSRRCRIPPRRLADRPRRRVAEVGAGRFELPTSRPQTGRSDQAELRPDGLSVGLVSAPLFGLDERAQFGELLAAELVALAPVDSAEQAAHERSEL